MKGKPLEISCPIYGFVRVDSDEREVVEHPVFQRLRRIRQLGWTDAIFPGAMHTRFQHSLGVMHMATEMFDQLCRRAEERPRRSFDFSPSDLKRWRQIIRLAALLHDLGHGPFSHAAEEVLPPNPNTGKPYQHEDYSIAAIRYAFPQIIDEYPGVIELIAKDSGKPECRLWRQIISGQVDADRMDYLLRDAHHASLPYGGYDWRRILSTVDFFNLSDGVAHIGVRRGGRATPPKASYWHAT